MRSKVTILRVAMLVLVILTMAGSTVPGASVELWGPIAAAPVVAAPDAPDGPAITDCDDRNLCVPWRGGMRILSSLYDPGAATCTAGFMARGNDAPSAYLLAAGHCFAEGKIKTSTVFDAAGSMNGGQRCRKVDIFPTYCRMLGGDRIGVSHPHDAATDTAKVSVASPLPRDMNALFIDDGSGHSGHVTAVAQQGSLTTDSVVCHSGFTSGVHCGRIVDLEVSGLDGVRLIGADARTEDGDSGGPVYLQTEDPDHLTAVGITVQSGPACLFWWTCPKQLLFVPIWEVEAAHDVTVCTTSDCGLPMTTGTLPHADFTISRGDALVGERIEVTDRSSGGATAPTYDWGDGATTTGPTHRYAIPGQYLVIQNVANEAGRSAAYHTLSVGPACPRSAPDPSGAAMIGANLPLVGAACTAALVGSREARFVGSHDPACGAPDGPACYPTVDGLRSAMKQIVDRELAALSWPPTTSVLIGCAPQDVGEPGTMADCDERGPSIFWVSATLRETSHGETNTFRGAAGVPISLSSER